MNRVKATQRRHLYFLTNSYPLDSLSEKLRFSAKYTGWSNQTRLPENKKIILEYTILKGWSHLLHGY